MLREERLAVVLRRLLHPTSNRTRSHNPRRRSRDIPVPLLILLMLYLEALVFDLVPSRAEQGREGGMVWGRLVQTFRV